MKKSVYERGEILENINGQKILIIGRCKYGYSVLAISDHNSNQDIPDLKIEYGEVLLGGMFLKNSIIADYYNLIGKLTKIDYLKIININTDFQKGIINLDDGILKYDDWYSSNSAQYQIPKKTYKTPTTNISNDDNTSSKFIEKEDTDAVSLDIEKFDSTEKKIDIISEETKINVTDKMSTTISSKSSIRLIDSLPRDNESLKMYYSDEEVFNIASMTIKAIMNKYNVKSYIATQMLLNAKAFFGIKKEHKKKNDFKSFFDAGGTAEDWLSINKNISRDEIYRVNRAYKNYINNAPSSKIEGSPIEKVLDNIPLYDIAALTGLISEAEEARVKTIYKSQIPESVDLKSKKNIEFIKLNYLSKSIYFQAGICPELAFDPYCTIDKMIAYYMQKKTKWNMMTCELIKLLAKLEEYYTKYWDRHADISSKLLTFPELSDTEAHALWYLSSSRYSSRMKFENTPKEKEYLSTGVPITLNIVLYFGIVPEKLSRRKQGYSNKCHRLSE